MDQQAQTLQGPVYWLGMLAVASALALVGWLAIPRYPETKRPAVTTEDSIGEKNVPSRGPNVPLRPSDSRGSADNNN